jgi:hypothetical protein
MTECWARTAPLPLAPSTDSRHIVVGVMLPSVLSPLSEVRQGNICPAMFYTGLVYSGWNGLSDGCLQCPFLICLHIKQFSPVVQEKPSSLIVFHSTWQACWCA